MDVIMLDGMTAKHVSTCQRPGCENPAVVIHGYDCAEASVFCLEHSNQSVSAGLDVRRVTCPNCACVHPA
jgi:hypothetical protein